MAYKVILRVAKGNPFQYTVSALSEYDAAGLAEAEHAIWGYDVSEIYEIVVMEAEFL